MQMRKSGHTILRNWLWALSHHSGLCAITAPAWLWRHPEKAVYFLFADVAPCL